MSRDFGYPIDNNKFGMTHPPQQTGSVDDYNNKFEIYMLHTNKFNEQQHMNFYINGLKEPIRSSVAKHIPQELETSIMWTCAHEQQIAAKTRSTTTT